MNDDPQSSSYERRIAELTAERDRLRQNLRELQKERDDLHSMISYQMTKDLTLEQCEAEFREIMAGPLYDLGEIIDELEELAKENEKGTEE